MNPTITASDSGGWWDTLVKTSPQGEIFNSQWFIDALKINYTLYKVADNSGRILAGFCILEDANELMSQAPILLLHIKVSCFQKIYQICQFIKKMELSFS